MSDAQERIAASALQKHTALTGSVNIIYEWSAPDGEATANQVKKILAAANIESSIGGTGSYYEYQGAPSYSGASFANVQDGNRDLAAALEAAFGAAKVVVGPKIKALPGNASPPILRVIIRKP